MSKRFIHSTPEYFLNWDSCMNGAEKMRFRFRQKEGYRGCHGLGLSRTAIMFPTRRDMPLPSKDVKKLIDWQRLFDQPERLISKGRKTCHTRRYTMQCILKILAAIGSKFTTAKNDDYAALAHSQSVEAVATGGVVSDLELFGQGNDGSVCDVGPVHGRRYVCH